MRGLADTHQARLVFNAERPDLIEVTAHRIALNMFSDASVFEQGGNTCLDSPSSLLGQSVWLPGASATPSPSFIEEMSRLFGVVH